MAKSNFNEFKNSTSSKETATTQSNSIQEAFKTYRNIMQELQGLYFRYASALRVAATKRMAEQVLNEAISDAEKAKIERDILNLKNAIEDLTNELSEHLQFICECLEREDVAMTRFEIDEVNSNHVEAMEYYNNCVCTLEKLENKYPKYDFSKIDFFSATERQKLLLDIAIKNYNSNNLRLMDYKLLTIREAHNAAFDNENNLKSNMRRRFKNL